jgi:hypothetical protein
LKFEIIVLDAIYVLLIWFELSFIRDLIFDIE